MELSLRSHSVNTYCLSKVWFKSASIDLRVMDSNQILSNIKSWIYADQLIKPEELVLYRSRQLGGLGLVNVKYRAMAELIKSFLDTAINSKFKRNLYHHALYRWHIEDDRDIPNPGKPPYFSDRGLETKFYDSRNVVQGSYGRKYYSRKGSEWFLFPHTDESREAEAK